MKLWEESFQEKVIPPHLLKEKVDELKKAGKTIATLNGSFDLLHAGHLQILFEASQVADIIIVALNSDESIKQYKSETRPIIPLKYRLQMIAALGFIDYVTWFEETDPIALLEKIRPDVHVNGSEYGEECMEADTVRSHGGTIHVVKLIPGLSTSEIIAKIQLLQPQRS